MDKSNNDTSLWGKYQKLNDSTETTELFIKNDSDMRKQLFQETDEQFKKQDVMLDALGNVVKDIKGIAIEMNAEIKQHNEIIEDTSEHVDITKDKLQKTTKQISKIIREKKCCSCGDAYAWIICAILLVSVFTAIILIIIFEKFVKN